MANEDLHRSLEELHRQLEGSRTIDEGTRTHLRQVMDEIRQRLGDGAAAPAEAESGPGDRLREALLRFEGDHPTLAVAIERVLDLLNRTGI